MSWTKLLAEKRVAAQPTSEQELDELRKMVAVNLHDAAVPGLSSQGRYEFAYNASRLMATVVVRSCGYRVTSKAGHHYFTFQALQAADPDFVKPAIYFDAARDVRNEFSYDPAGPVSDTDAEDLLRTVEQFVADAEAWIRMPMRAMRTPKQSASDPSETLAEYIRTLPHFTIATTIDGNYRHVGATLTDAVLQAGVKYSTVVRPRVQHLLAEYPQARTTKGFAELLDSVGAERVLNWNGKRKLATLRELIALLMAEKVDSEDDLRSWIASTDNMNRLREIKGIKEKTAHYLAILVGVQTVAVDTHLFRFVEEAGLATGGDYEVAHKIIFDAAGLMNIDASVLDHSIWRYMSERLASTVKQTTDCKIGRTD